MNVSVICTWKAYFSSDIEVYFCNKFFRKIPFRKMCSVIM